MEGREPLHATLVAPPPPLQARLVRPPRRGALPRIGRALAAARHLRLPLLLLGCARLLRAAASAAPLVIALGAWRVALSRSGDPFAAAVQTLRDPAVLLPTAGFAASAVLAAALLEVAGWTFGLPALAGRLGAPAPDQPIGRRFARLLQTGLLLLLVAFVWACAVLPLVVVAADLWLDAHGARTSGALLASAALALVLAIAVGGSLILRLGAEAAIVHAGARGERPLLAIHEGFALVLRQPAVLLAAVYLLGLAGLLAGLVFGLPGALAPPGTAGFPVRVLVEVATAAAAALLALARLGVFVDAAAARSSR